MGKILHNLLMFCTSFLVPDSPRILSSLCLGRHLGSILLGVCFASGLICAECDLFAIRDVSYVDQTPVPPQRLKAWYSACLPV